MTADRLVSPPPHALLLLLLHSELLLLKLRLRRLPAPRTPNTAGERYVDGDCIPAKVEVGARGPVEDEER